MTTNTKKTLVELAVNISVLFIAVAYAFLLLWLRGDI